MISDQGNNFHTEWDAIPSDSGRAKSLDMVKKAQAVAPTAGPVGNFAVIWGGGHRYGLPFGVRGPRPLPELVRSTGPYNSPTVMHIGMPRIAQGEINWRGGARLAQLLNAIWPSPAPAPLEKATACTAINICYCVTSANRDAITANVARIRHLLADQRAAAKMIGYLSVPLSTVGGSYFGVNREVAQQTKDRIERRLGSGSAWILNPGTEGSLPENASGADYMYMLAPKSSRVAAAMARTSISSTSLVRRLRAFLCADRCWRC